MCAVEGGGGCPCRFRSRLSTWRIAAVTGGVPLLVRLDCRRQGHEHFVFTDPIDEAGRGQDLAQLELHSGKCETDAAFGQCPR